MPPEPTTPPSFDAVSFALWQTIVDESPSFHSEVMNRRAAAITCLAHEYGSRISADAASRAYRTASDFLEGDWKRGVPIDNQRRVRIILRELDLHLPDIAAASLVDALEASHRREGIVIDEHAEAVLADLAHDYILFLISDTWMTPSRELVSVLESSAVARHFAGMSFSDQTGVSKINGDAFVRTFEGTGIDLSRVVHVGDLGPVDVRGAQLAGVGATILIDRLYHPVRFPAEPGFDVKPTATVTSLAHVPRAVREL